MAKFLLNGGAHQEGSRLYYAGDVIESPHDLSKSFRGKFTRVNTATPTSAGDIFPAQPTVALPADEPELEAAASATEAIPAPGVAAGALAGPLGVDVTDKFLKAGEQDFKVYKADGFYFVYDADDLKKPFNAEGVKKAEVDGIVETNS